MIRFYYTNRWKLGTITASSEHAHFPVENTQNRFPSESWRSNYGVGSGWGTFLIEVGVNDRLDFEETAGVNLAALLTPGTYDANTLCTHLKTQMEAVGASTYTWEYLETGTNKNKFRVTSDGAGGGGILNIEWSTGPNSARSIGTDIGYDVSADDIGALVYLADYIRIHTHEVVTNRLGTQYPIYGVFIKLHNFQDSALVKIQMSNNNFVAIPVDLTLTITDDVIAVVFDTPRTYEDFRYWIEDPSNADGFVEMGICFIGPHLAPERNFHYTRNVDPADPSRILESEGGQESTIQHEKFNTYRYYFNGTNEKTDFDTMFDDRGYSRELFYVEDHVYYESMSRFVKIIEYAPDHLQGAYWNINLRLQELR